MSRRVMLLAVERLAAMLAAGPTVSLALGVSTTARAQTSPQSQNYSPYAEGRHPTRVYWGDQHLHTSHSPDAGLVGDRLGPDEAFRFPPV